MSLAARVRISLGKLDERATEKQGGVELRGYLEHGGADCIPTLVPEILKNFKRPKLCTVAVCDCVAVLADAVEREPEAASAYLQSLVKAVVKQLSRPDARCREACAGALGRMAAACSTLPAADAPAWGHVPAQRLSHFFAPLMGALGDPNASQQEGGAAAIVAVLRRAAAADVGASLPVLLPRLLRSLSPSLLAQTAVLVALEATLDAAAPSLLGAHASAIRAAAAKALESKDFKVRGAAAKMVLPLLRAADASAAGNDGVDGEDGVSVENLRAKLEAVRYDRFEQVRKAAGAAIALLPPPPPADAVAPTPARPSTAKKARASGRPSLLSSTMPTPSRTPLPKAPTEAFVRSHKPGSPVLVLAPEPRTLRPPEEVPSPSPLSPVDGGARRAAAAAGASREADAKKAEAPVRFDKENTSPAVAAAAASPRDSALHVRALVSEPSPDLIAMTPSPRAAPAAPPNTAADLAATIGPLISPSALISLVAMEGTAMEGTAAAEGDGETAEGDENLSPEGEHPDARAPTLSATEHVRALQELPAAAAEADDDAPPPPDVVVDDDAAAVAAVAPPSLASSMGETRYFEANEFVDADDEEAAEGDAPVEPPPPVETLGAALPASPLADFEIFSDGAASRPKSPWTSAGELARVRAEAARLAGEVAAAEAKLAAEKRAHEAELSVLKQALLAEKQQRKTLEFRCAELERMR